MAPEAVDVGRDMDAELDDPDEMGSLLKQLGKATGFFLHGERVSEVGDLATPRVPRTFVEYFDDWTR